MLNRRTFLKAGTLALLTIPFRNIQLPKNSESKFGKFTSSFNFNNEWKIEWHNWRRVPYDAEMLHANWIAHPILKGNYDHSRLSYLVLVKAKKEDFLIFNNTITEWDNSKQIIWEIKQNGYDSLCYHLEGDEKFGCPVFMDENDELVPDNDGIRTLNLLKKRNNNNVKQKKLL